MNKQFSKLYLLFSSLFLLMVIGCSNSQDDGFRQGDLPQDQSQLAACAQTSPTTDALAHKQLLSLFECLGWDESYPKIYGAINKIPAKRWGLFIQPWHQYLLGWSGDSKENRNKLKEIKKVQWNQLRQDQTNEDSFNRLALKIIDHYPDMKFQGEFKSHGAWWRRINLHYSQTLAAMQSFENIHGDYLRYLGNPPIKLTGKRELIFKTVLNLGKLNLNQEKIDIFQRILYFDVDDVPWPIFWGNYFKQAARESDFWHAITFKTPDEDLLIKIPSLLNLLERGMKCTSSADFSLIDIQENFFEKFNNITTQTVDDFYFEIIDLNLKLVGIKDLCQLEAHESDYKLAEQTLHDLESYFLKPGNFLVLQTILKSFKVQKLNVEDILGIYGNPQVNNLLQDWSVATQQDHEFAKSIVTLLSSLSDETWTNLVQTIVSSPMNDLVQDLTQEPQMFSDLLETAWPLINIFSSDEEGFKITPLIKFFLPHEIVEKVLQEEEFKVLEEIKHRLFDDEMVRNEFRSFINDGQWWVLLDLVFSTQPNAGLIEKEEKLPSSLAMQPAISLDSPIKSCLQTLHFMQLASLSDYAQNFPESCAQIATRQGKDFPFLVARDLNRLAGLMETHLQEQVFKQWGLLDPQTLHLIAKLFLEGGKYPGGGFSNFWNDIQIVFNDTHMKKFISNYIKNPETMDLPSFSQLAPVFATGPKLLNSLKDHRQELALILDIFSTEKDFTFSDYLELFILANAVETQSSVVLSDGKYVLTALQKLELLLQRGSIQQGKFIQKIIDDLVKSKKWKQKIKYYQGSLNKSVNSDLISNILNLSHEERLQLGDALKLLDVFTQIDQLKIANRSGMAVLLDMLKFFTSKNERSLISLALTNNADVSKNLSTLLNLNKLSILSTMVNTIQKQISLDQFQQLKFFLDNKKLMNQVLKSDELYHLVEFLSEEKQQHSLQGLSVYFSNPELSFSILGQNFPVDSVSDFLMLFSDDDFEKVYDYYFNNYGAPMILMSHEVDGALNGVAN